MDKSIVSPFLTHGVQYTQLTSPMNVTSTHGSWQIRFPIILNFKVTIENQQKVAHALLIGAKTLDDLEGSLCTLFQNMYHGVISLYSFTFNLFLALNDCIRRST